MSNSGILNYINQNSDYVFVNKNKLNSFINNIDNWDYNYWLDSNDLILSEKEKIIFAFLCESINFCFWPNRKWIVEYKGKKFSGSEALFYSLIKAINESKLVMNLDNLSNIKKSEFEIIMKSNNELPPLIEERYCLFKKTIKVLHQKDELFFKELFSLKNDEELLSYIVDNFSHFDDKSDFKGRTIHFNKRAILLVNDLFNLSATIRNNIKNIDGLTGGADYSIPKVFAAYGVFEYNYKLLNMIKTGFLIEHNSQMEVEIRGNTLYVIELIKSILKEKKIYINSVQLDNIIWKMRLFINDDMLVHHTKSIYY